MLDITLAPVLFILFYLVPGAVLLSNTPFKGRRLESVALAVLLSLIFAPLTFTLFSRVFPGNDNLLLAGYIGFWILFAAGVRFFPQTLKARLPDFRAIPNADRIAWLVSILLAAIVVSLRLGILRGQVSQIGDDDFHLTKLTAIAATGLPSLHARQPLYPFVYYDLDYIAPAFWARYTSGTVGIALAWVVHTGVQSLVVSLFLIRLMYIFARSRITRMFGLLALHTATGLDLLFLPQLLDLHQRPGLPHVHLDHWASRLGLFDGFMQISLPITLHVWVPQHQLGMAVLGLIFLVTIASRNRGIPQMVATALLVAALFRTSTFVFLGALPGLALWYLYKLWTDQDRLRQLLYLATAALVVLVLLFPSFIDFSAKRSFLEFGLRSFAFLDIPGAPWLKYPVTAFTYLLLETGIPFVILLWLLLRPSLHAGPIRFWVFTASALLIPLVVQIKDTNDIAMRGVIPGQLSLALIGCFALTHLEAGRRGVAAAVVLAQSILSLSAVSVELYWRYTDVKPPIPATSQWIAANTPLDSLVFYEHRATTVHEANYGNRMTYTVWRRSFIDLQHTPFPPGAWSCLPEFNLYNEVSLCAIEALIPGAQPVYVKYSAADPQLDSPAFTLAHQTPDASVYSLACPTHEPPQFSKPPVWTIGPYPQYQALLQTVPDNHVVAATSQDLADWLGEGDIEQRILEVAYDPDMEAIDRRAQLDRQLRAVDELSFPVWLLLDYTKDHLWNEEILAHVLANHYVAQPAASPAEWLQCKQRVVLSLPLSGDELHSVHNSISFGEKLVVNEWRVGSRSYKPGEIIPVELAWSSLDGGNLKFYVHLLDLDWNLFAQIDLGATTDGTADSQLTRMGLYLPPDLPAGEYQVRLGVYRASDGQRLTLPTGEDSVHIPFTVTQ